MVRNVPGNHFDKHGSQNVLVRRMMERFHSGVIERIRASEHRSILDVGCGEGLTTGIVAAAVRADLIIGCDLEVSAVREGPSNAPVAHFLAASGYSLPFSTDAFDIVMATEVLEHLDDPASAVRELGRVARHAVVVTVPNEPWWRMGNMARGRYLRDLGNTPGHVQHWSTSAFRAFLAEHFEDIEVERVSMWNQALARL